MKRSLIRSKRTKPRPGRLKGEDLQALRLACFERDNGICQALLPSGRASYRCSTKTFMDLPHTAPNSFHMSHKQAKRRGGDSLDNVETSCGECHRIFHAYGPNMEKPCLSKQKVYETPDEGTDTWAQGGNQ